MGKFKCNIHSVLRFNVLVRFDIAGNRTKETSFNDFEYRKSNSLIIYRNSIQKMRIIWMIN
jgi:hypothetical protein